MCLIILPKTRQLNKYLKYIKFILILYIILLTIDIFKNLGHSFTFLTIILFLIIIILKRHYHFARISTLWIFVDIFIFIIKLGILIQTSSNNLFLYLYYLVVLSLSITSILILHLVHGELKAIFYQVYLNHDYGLVFENEESKEYELKDMSGDYVNIPVKNNNTKKKGYIPFSGKGTVVG